MEERAVMHGADPGDEGREGAHDGDETAQENSFVAVFFVKALGLFHVFRPNQAVVAFEQFEAELLADPVIARIAQDGSDETDGVEVAEMEAVGRRGQGAAREEQGIARQEGRHDEARFTEQDQEQQEIDQGTVGRHDGRDIAVKMENIFTEEIGELVQCIHDAGDLLYACPGNLVFPKIDSIVT